MDAYHVPLYEALIQRRDEEQLSAIAEITKKPFITLAFRRGWMIV